jgi:exodeoxyribonuclease V alpha subunit
MSTTSQRQFWAKKHGKKPGGPRPAPAPLNPGEREVAGEVVSVLFRNEENGYTICRVKSSASHEPVVVVGTCSAIWEGELLKADGAWTRNPKHGHQFEAESITCMAPTSAKGIERFLASGLIRGVGKVNAKRLVDRFGEETLYIIEHESKRVEEVEGIGPVRRKRIKESWNEQRGIRDVLIFLQGHGIGSAQATRIYRAYKEESVALVRTDPYRLCRDIWGIGFKTADSVAQSLGVPHDSPKRARAGIVHVVGCLTDEGHCFCPRQELLDMSEELLGIPATVMEAALAAELEHGTLVAEEEDIYRSDVLQAERMVVQSFRNILATASAVREVKTDKAVGWAAEKMDLGFAPRQIEALETALASRISVMTGGPGVGKTTIIRALVEVFKAMKLRVCLSAPTGRAAKRMEEATHHEAKTIHRQLKYQPRTRDFDHDASNPMEGDVFILDEASMLDIHLASSFLQAVPACARVVLVGDTDQLPSVGPGNVLRDIIHSGTIPCVHLDAIFRQEAGSGIIANAHRINQGDGLDMAGSKDFFFIEADDSDTVIQRMIELVTDRIPKRFGFDPLRQIQVLSPMRRNQLGCDNLNAVLQQALNATGHSISRFGREYRKGDRVMQVRNNYDKDIFNGDVGHISYVNEEEQELTVDMDGGKVVYEFSELDELVHAYACTIHKSQGSEYPAVVVLISTQHFKLLQRNLLYTAVTRGRQLVCVVGSTKAVNMAIRNNEIKLRRTGLRVRLQADLEMVDVM